MLLAAVSRDDRFLQPAANARRPALKTFADKLIDAGWAKEVKTTHAVLAWRRNAASGEAFALRMTAKGVKAAAAASEAAAGAVRSPVAPAGARQVKIEPESRSATSSLTTATQAATNSGGESSTTTARAPRPDSKLGRVLDMLAADAGATIGDLTAATGWLEHTTRAALTGLRRRGYELSLTRKEREGASVYRIVDNASEASK
jgi:hypothetical protein